MDDFDQPQNDAWVVTYSDHSGNRYRFWQDGAEETARFEYHPVTPKSSSTGTYSGGRPGKGTLDPAEVEALFEWIGDLEADTATHAGSRMMGTGSFRVSANGRERRFIIKSGNRREAFDAFVRPFREPPMAKRRLETRAILGADPDVGTTC